MKRVDAAWLAAAIDGEGTITIHSKKNKTYGSHYTPRILLYNNNKEFVENVLRLCGAGGISQKSYEISGVKRITYKFGVSRKEELVRILNSIIPYLIIKRKNAVEVLRFLKNSDYEFTLDHSHKRISSMKRTGRTHLKGNRTDSSELKKFYAFGYSKKEALSMIKKGIVPTSRASDHDKGWRGDIEGHSMAGRSRHH